jgi:hypothetical protein
MWLIELKIAVTAPQPNDADAFTAHISLSFGLKTCLWG